MMLPTRKSIIKVAVLILVLISLLPKPACAYVIRQIFESLNVGKLPPFATDTLTQHDHRVPPFHKIVQGLSYAADRANAVSLKDKADRAVSNKLDGVDGDAATSALVTFGNHLISSSTDIVTRKVNAVVARTSLEANVKKLKPMNFTSVDDRVRLRTGSIISKQLIDPMLDQRVNAVGNHAHSDSVMRRAESFLTRKPGAQFGNEFGTSEQKPCVDPPASRRLNLTSVAYDYPQNAINLELRQRPDIMLDILRSRRFNLRDPDEQMKGSSFSHGLSSGCFSTKETLEAFQVQGVECWVIFSRHQNVQFYRCGSSKCGMGVANFCSSSDEITALWAWCNTASDGHKIVKLELPLPVSCKCERVTLCGYN